MDNDFYIYVHIRKDTGFPFYIGKGRKRRAYSKDKRNRHWKSIVEKVGYSIDFLATGLTEEQAFLEETEYISMFGRKRDGGCLCNWTDGGGGISGYSHTIESRKAISIGHIGKISTLTGRIRPAEVVSKIANSNRGQKRSIESRLNMRNAQLGKILTDITKEKMRQRTGERSPASVLVFDTQTGIFYVSVKEAAEAWGLRPALLSRYLTGDRRNKTNYIYA